MAKQPPKKLLSAIAILLIAIVAYFQRPTTRVQETGEPGGTSPRTTRDHKTGEPGGVRPRATDNDDLLQAIDQRLTNVQVQGHGIVDRILADDNQGSRHQRFILRIDSERTVLVTHNIDLAPRIPQLQRGDSVSFAGEYVWNSQGGVIHWTHHDPRGRRSDGWLQHQGKTYQ
jgi:hypothetical protein